MKITVAKQDLEAALAVVSSSISSGGNDIHSHYVFRVTADDASQEVVDILTSSGRMFGGCRVQAAKVEDFEEDTMFTIEGKRLKALLPHVGEPSVLTIDYDDETKVVIVKTKSTAPEFQSLNAETFKLWDDALEAAEVSCTLPASRLLAAIDYSSSFVSDQEGSNPNLCVLEAREGVIYSTDKRAATLVKVDDIAESALRIHGKDASSAVAFLTLCGEGDVEVREGDKTQFLVRKDGALFGTARFLARFPDIGISMEDENQHQWLLPRAEIVRGIGQLTAAAAKEDSRLRIRKDDGMVILSMRAMTGKVIDFPVEVAESESADDAPDLPTNGFTLDHNCLSKVLKSWGGDTIRFGVNTRGKDGFCRFLSEAEGNTFLSIVAWAGK